MKQVEAWRSVAAGWERQRDLFARATADLSQRMLDRLEPEAGASLLELAAGPGELGFMALPLVLPGGELLSTDAAPEMVEVARRRAAELALASVRFAVEDAASLSLADACVDRILCRFGLMLVPDMRSAAREMARVLRPGGRVVLAVWASSRLNPWITASGRAALELGLSEPPDHSAPGPFRLADPNELRSIVTEGGLEIESVEDVVVSWEAASIGEWWDVSQDTSRMLTVLLQRLTAGQAEALRARAGELLEEFVAPDGSVAAPGVARVVTATRA